MKVKSNNTGIVLCFEKGSFQILKARLPRSNPLAHLVVEDTLEEATVIVLCQPPVQHDLQLSRGHTAPTQGLASDQGQSALIVLQEVILNDVL